MKIQIQISLVGQQLFHCTPWHHCFRQRAQAKRQKQEAFIIRDQFQNLCCVFAPKSILNRALHRDGVCTVVCSSRSKQNTVTTRCFGRPQKWPPRLNQEQMSWWTNLLCPEGGVVFQQKNKESQKIIIFTALSRIFRKAIWLVEFQLKSIIDGWTWNREITREVGQNF